jgi:hypothetical protein
MTFAGVCALTFIYVIGHLDPVETSPRNPKPSTP